MFSLSLPRYLLDTNRNPVMSSVSWPYNQGLGFDVPFGVTCTTIDSYHSLIRNTIFLV